MATGGEDGCRLLRNQSHIADIVIALCEWLDVQDHGEPSWPKKKGVTVQSGVMAFFFGGIHNEASNPKTSLHKPKPKKSSHSPKSKSWSALANIFSSHRQSRACKLFAPVGNCTHQVPLQAIYVQTTGMAP